MLKNFFSLIEKIKYKNFIIILLAAAFVVLFLPKEGKFKYDYKKAKTWQHEDLYSPFDFSILKTEEEIEKDKKELLANVYPVYNYSHENKQSILENFDKKFESDWDYLSNESNYTDAQKSNIYILTKSILESILEKGIINFKGPNIKNYIYIDDNNILKVKDVESFFTITEANDFAESKVYNQSAELQFFITTVISSVINYNVIYDEVKSDKLIQNKLSNISYNKGKIDKNELIISKGELVGKEKFNVLQSLEAKYIEKTGGKHSYYIITLGQSILTILILTLLFWFIYVFRSEVFVDIYRMSFILISFMLTVLMALITIKVEIIPIYALPFCILPIVIKAFFDTRLALFIFLNAILLISFIAPNGYEFIIIQLVAGMFGIFSIVDMSRRSQLFKTILTIFFVYVLTYSAFNLIKDGNFDGFHINYIYWFLASTVLTLFSFPLIFVSEKVFGFMSDVTLIELSDTNNKLLRELSLKAPGTFQHSMQVANLSEAAIRAIGGDVLLVRTGAMYHDIGKLEMPMFYIENQNMNTNPHDNISCAESAKIIINHVNKGIEIAKENGLPEKIIDFIRTHHGDGVVKYFYFNELKNKKAQNCEDEVDINDFRYQGPKPFSKEMAVLMMADAVEASSRSLKEHTEQKISDLVDNIINDQVNESQFSNSDITFKDISVVKDILKKKLLNIYHVRVEYPEKS